MSWSEKMKEFGGGDLAFLSEDGEVIRFIIVGEPILLEGKFKGKPSEKIGCPVMTEDGFLLFVVGKRLARKISKHEDKFDNAVFMAIRHGEQGDIESKYDLKVLDDDVLAAKLFDLKQTEFRTEMIKEAEVSALSVMRQ